MLERMLRGILVVKDLKLYNPDTFPFQLVFSRKSGKDLFCDYEI